MVDMFWTGLITSGVKFRCKMKYLGVVALCFSCLDRGYVMSA